MKRVIVADYSKQLAEEFGVPEKDVKKALNIGFRNLARIVERGECVWIKGFGEFKKIKHARPSGSVEGPLVDTSEQDLESVLKLLGL